MTATGRRKYKSAWGVAAVALLVAGCGPEVNYGAVYSRRSPDGKWTAAVSLFGIDKWAAPQRLKILVEGGGRRIVLHKDSASDIDVCFAEIYWSENSQQVGVLVRNCYGRSPLIVGYDISSNSSVPRPAIEGGIRKRIRQDYPRWRQYIWGQRSEIVEHPDEIQYAATDEAASAFRARERSGADRRPG